VAVASEYCLVEVRADHPVRFMDTMENGYPIVDTEEDGEEYNGDEEG
jgi:hypothetical protein